MKYLNKLFKYKGLYIRELYIRCNSEFNSDRINYLFEVKQIFSKFMKESFSDSNRIESYLVQLQSLFLIIIIKIIFKFSTCYVIHIFNGKYLNERLILISTK